MTGISTLKKTFFLCMLCLVSAFFLAEEPLTRPVGLEVPPPPVISGLEAQLSGNSVTLTWIEAPEIEGEHLILRYNQPITAANYLSAEKRAQVPPKTTTFTDTIDKGQDYYYAILTRDTDGTLYDFFIPASNSMISSISGTVAPEKPSVDITAVDAMVRNDAIILSWTNPAKGSSLVVYRSTQPFTELASLTQAIVLSTIIDTGTPFVDYPVPGVPYYYALMEESSLLTGQAQFTPGKNTTRAPVEVSASFAKFPASKMPKVRPVPLPWLNPSRKASKPVWQFSTQTENMITKILPAEVNLPVVYHEPYVFRMDIESTGSGEEYALRSILEKSFLPGHWEKTIEDLEKFLSLRRTIPTTARARFYLGQAYYFNNKDNKALIEFLLSQNVYYTQSREWIQYIMNRLGS
ncbi:MAG: hypothetical protein JW875_07955 [Spirochaetales bacterium]|nr:hypothetical protein [Spirochaetales bacterium]